MTSTDLKQQVDTDSDEFGPIDSLRPIGEVLRGLVSKVTNKENQESDNGQS